jgi:hypothetical protein
VNEYWVTWGVIALVCAILSGFLGAGLTVAWARWMDRRDYEREFGKQPKVPGQRTSDEDDAF